MDMLPFHRRTESQTTTHTHTYSQLRVGTAHACFWTVEIPHGENVETPHRKAKCGNRSNSHFVSQAVL